MLGAARSSSAQSRRVRWSTFPASCGSIAAGLLVATCCNAATSGLLAQNQTQPGRDTVSTVPSVPAATSTTPGQVSTPRRPGYSLHLHGGLFAPIDVNATSPTIGLRFGRFVGPHLQAGLLTGATFRRKNLEEPVSGLPGLKPHLVLARIDGYLVPAMLFLHVNLTEKRFLAPYAGIATGYEWLTLTANDYRTDQSSTLSYANWAWEAWGGLGIRLGRDLRVDGEIFYNGGSLERDVTDASGRTWKEAVDANGVGARVGVDIPF